MPNFFGLVIGCIQWTSIRSHAAPPLHFSAPIISLQFRDLFPRFAADGVRKASNYQYRGINIHCYFNTSWINVIGELELFKEVKSKSKS